MKKTSLLAMLMALCLLFTLAACGRVEASEQPANTAQTPSPAEEQGTLAVELTVPSERPATVTCDGSVIYHLGQTDNALVVHSLDAESGQWTEVLRQDGALENAMQLFATVADGKLVAVIDPEDADAECAILCFDLSTGQLVSQSSLDMMDGLNGILGYEGKIMAWDAYNGQVTVLDLEGRKEASYSLNCSIQSVSCLDGTPIVCYATGNRIFLGTMDLKGYQQVTEITIDQRCELNCISNSPFLAGGTALYAFDMDAGRLEPVLYWRDIAQLRNPTQVFSLDSSTVIGYNEYYNAVIKYDLDAIPERQQITIGAMQYGAELEMAIAAFNSQSKEYVARLKIYGLGEMDRFLVDISSGDTLDIVCTGLHPDGTTLNYSTIDSGVFEDLLPYIDADPQLSRDAFLPQALDFMVDEKGRLYELFCFMTVSSMIGSREIAQQVSGPEDLLRLSAELPQGYALFGGLSQDSLLDYICQLASVYCVDFEGGQCDFSKGSFDKWLELYSSYQPYDQNVHEGYLISVPSTVTVIGAEAMRQRYGEDYQYMGWPNGQGNVPLLSGVNGGYCMLASSQHKDAAWQLLRTLLSIEYDNVVGAIMTPVMRDQFQQSLAALSDLNEEEGLDIRPEDIEKLVKFLDGPSLAPRTSGLDAIIKEEAKKYSAGQISLDAAVTSIQSRASIYMAEQYG